MRRFRTVWFTVFFHPISLSPTFLPGQPGQPGQIGCKPCYYWVNLSRQSRDTWPFCRDNRDTLRCPERAENRPYPLPLPG
jgi:hypothetical protein